MQEASKSILVNFRISPTHLARFDKACNLAGKSRTQVLIEMMQRYSANASAAIISQDVGDAAQIDFKRISRPISAKPVNETHLPITDLRSRKIPSFREWLGFRSSEAQEARS